VKALYIQASSYQGTPDRLVRLFEQASLEFISYPRIITKHGHRIMADSRDKLLISMMRTWLALGTAARAAVPISAIKRFEASGMFI
jgi:hypothetical protein